MSDVLDRAIAKLKTLPEEAQEEAGRLLLDWTNDFAPAVDDRSPEPVDPAHRAAIAEGLADVRAGRLASAEDIEAAFASFLPDR